MTKQMGLAAALAVVVLTGLSAPASARWWGDGHWHDDDRWRDHRHYYGYDYRPPPVVYGTPYNYGYVAPPVVYGDEPGLNLNIHIP